MTKAIVVNDYGSADVLQWQDIILPNLSEHDVLLDHKAIGFNMIDTYFRKGLYPMDTPFILGAEAVGVIREVGSAVSGFKRGDLVATVQPQHGAYAEQRVLPVSCLIKIPDAIDSETVAASLLKGMTAQYLLKQTYTVKAGDTIVVYAAAGGVGSIITQWAKYLGANIIAIVGSAEKVSIAKDNGADYVLSLDKIEIDVIAQKVRQITNGKGVPVVYDSLGKETYIASLDCLQPKGLLVSYGNATGAVDNLNLLDLAKRGSLFVTRPTLFSYIATPETMMATANDFFDVIKQGAVKIHIGQRFALQDAVKAHLAAESRKTTGSTVLLP